MNAFWEYGFDSQDTFYPCEWALQRFCKLQEAYALSVAVLVS